MARLVTYVVLEHCMMAKKLRISITGSIAIQLRLVEHSVITAEMA